ncbi:MAG TPA: hypothetical protein VJB97_01695 [Candidatus Paceibacterota bacterium]
MEPAESLPLIALTALAGNDQPQLDALQQALAPYISEIILMWWFAWFVVLIVVIRYAIVYGQRDYPSASA